MIEPIYYIEKEAEIRVNGSNVTFFGAGASALEDGLAELYRGNKGLGPVTLKFLAKGNVFSTILTTGVEVVIGDGEVTVAGQSFDAFATAAITAAILAPLSLPTMSLAAAVAISAVTSAVVSTVYSTFVEEHVDAIIDILSGTVDTDIQLKNSSGELLAGVLYKDGLQTGQTTDAVIELLKSPREHPDYPIAKAELNDRIEIFKGSSDTPWEVYKLYSNDLIDNIAEILFEGNHENIGSLTPNAIYAETIVDMADERWLLGRTKENGVDIEDYTLASDNLVLATNFFENGDLLGVHPELIAYADKNGDFKATTHQEWLVYFGNDTDNSVLAANKQNNQIFGGAGSDTLKGDAGDDYIYGDYGNRDSENVGNGGGSDHLYGGVGTDHVFGGMGDDFLYADSGAYGLEGDKYYGGHENFPTSLDGSDTLDYSNVNFGIRLNLGVNDPQILNSQKTTATEIDGLFQSFGIADEIYSIEKFILTDSTDWVTITTDVDYDIQSIDGKEGRNVIDFSELNNVVTVDLYNQVATLIGTTVDINELKNFGHVIGTNVSTGSVDDFFYGTEKSVIYDGLSGIDHLSYFHLNLAAIEVNLNAGQVIKYGTSLREPQTDYVDDIEIFTGTSGADFFRGKEGLDGVEFHALGQGAFGRDILDFSQYTNGVNADLFLGSVTDGQSATMVVSGFEQIIGSNHQDFISGAESTAWLFGQGGDDFLYGGAATDYLFGGTGMDTLSGGGGSDVYHYSYEGTEDSIADTSGSADTIYLDGLFKFTGDDIVDRSGSNPNIENVANFTDDIELLQFSDGATFQITNLGRTSTGLPEITGTLEQEELTGTAGADLIDGVGGGDTIYAGEGDDWIVANGTSYGEAGSDHISGIGHMIGGGGEDFITSMSDGNTLEGGADNDFLDGNGYDNTIYVVGDGIDVIKDTGTGGEIWITGGSAQTATYEFASNGSLIISPAGDQDTDKVIILNYKTSSLNTISFDDGQTLLSIPTDNIGFKTSIFDNAIVGSEGDNVYVASEESGRENYIGSNSGNNSYIFDLAYTGSTTISSTYDPLYTVQEKIILNDVTSINDVTVIRYSDDPDALNLFYGASGSVVLRGDLSTNYVISVDNTDYALNGLSIVTHGTSGDDKEIFGFGSPVSGDLAGFSVNDTLYGGFGDDELYGGLGNDILDGGDGADILDGGAGADTYMDSDGDDLYIIGEQDTLRVGSGLNIAETQDGFDDWSSVVLDFSGFGGLDNDNNVAYNGFYRDFSGSNSSDYKLSYSGGELTIDHYVDLTDVPQITLINGATVDLTSIIVEGFGSEGSDSYNEQLFFTQSDYVHAGGGDDSFVFTDGNDVAYGGEGADYLVKQIESGNTQFGTGNFTAYGEAGDDVLRGSIGDDYLDGGDGNDSIADFAGGIDHLVGGAGDDQFVLGWQGGDIVDGGEGNDTVTMVNADYYAGTIYSYEIDLVNQTVSNSVGTHQLISIENAAGGAGDDTLLGDDNNNILSGFSGDDELEGGLGDDTYYFDDFSNFSLPIQLGDDVIYDTGGDADAIQLEHVADANTLTIEESGSDLVITFANGGSLEITDQLLGGSNQIENLILSNGVTLDLINYTSWYDPGSGSGGGTVYAGTSASESFVGDSATMDTVDYSASTGLVSINLGQGTGNLGYAYGDTYVSIENIIGSAFNDFLTGSGDSNELQGNDGDDFLLGDSGNDILAGGSGNDVLWGGADNDQLEGGSGDDAYVFNIGDGINTIIETSGFDTIVLGSGITLGDIVFSQVGNDLDIQIASGFLIKDFYSGDADKVVEQLAFDDGSYFDLTTLLTAAPPESPDAINIASTGFNAYSGNQDAGGVASLIYSATGAALEGNAWKKIVVPMEYTVTSDTYITFEYKSTIQGEIQGFGLDTDDDYSTGPSPFQLYGTDDPSSFIDTYTYTGAGDWQYFSINVGAHQTGAIDFLTFINDHDAAPQDGNSYFRNVVLYERDAGTINIAPQAIADEFEGLINTAIVGNVFDDNFHGLDFDVDNDVLSAVAETITTANGSVVISANGDFIYTPDTNFTGTDSFVYIVEDGNGGSDTVTATLFIGTTDADQTFTTSSAYEFYNGGAGIDTVDYSTSQVKVHLNLGAGIGWNGDANDDTYVHIENVIGSDLTSSGDLIYGNEAENHIWGMAGNDQLEGMGGADTIDGGSGADYVSYSRSDSGVNVNLKTGVNTGGDAEGDTLISIENIHGSNYDDVLTGSDGGNTIYADYGDDLLYGGAGADILYGEEGADTFVFGASDTFGYVDTIKDFDVAEGDKIDISDLLSNYDPLTDAISDFVQFTTSGSTNAHGAISVDVDGGADNFVLIAYITDQPSLDAETLETSGNLIAA